jgi:esterase/lipase
MSAKVLRGLTKGFITLIYLINSNFGDFFVKKLLFQPPEDYVEDKSIIKSGENCWIHLNSKANNDIILVFLHGNASDISMNKEMGKMLSEIGDVYIPEYPGYGAMRKYFPRRNSDGMMTTLRSFFENVIDPVRDGRNVCIVGQSLGTHYAARLAAEGYCTHLCLISAFYSLERIAFESEHTIGKMLYDTSQYIENVTANTLFLHGKDDSVIPYHHSQDLYEKCKSQTKAIKILKNGHSLNMMDILYELKHMVHVK